MDKQINTYMKNRAMSIDQSMDGWVDRSVTEWTGKWTRINT